MKFSILHRYYRPRFRIYLNYVLSKLGNAIPPGELKNRFFKAMGVHMGDDVFLSPGVIIDPVFPEFVHLGDHVVLGWNARIFAHVVTPYRKDTYRKLLDLYDEGRLKILKVIVNDDAKYQMILSAGPIYIEDGAFIGAFTTVRAGVRVGEGAIVGSDSLVTKDIPAWSVAIGKPAKIIKEGEKWQE